MLGLYSKHSDVASPTSNSVDSFDNTTSSKAAQPSDYHTKRRFLHTCATCRTREPRTSTGLQRVSFLPISAAEKIRLIETTSALRPTLYGFTGTLWGKVTERCLREATSRAVLGWSVVSYATNDVLQLFMIDYPKLSETKGKN
eukprot:4319851-Amphidinium_carterae.1